MTDDVIVKARQPVVTSLGILLGFLLNFLAQWALRDDAKSAAGGAAVQTATDWIIVISLFGAVTLMLVVLFGILSNKYDPEHADTRYSNLLRLYSLAITLVFAGLAVALFV